MEYSGKREEAKVRIKQGAPGFLAKYVGQECDAILYDDGHAQIDTEQLKPPIPKWQSAQQKYLERIG